MNNLNKLRRLAGLPSKFDAPKPLMEARQDLAALMTRRAQLRKELDLTEKAINALKALNESLDNPMMDISDEELNRENPDEFAELSADADAVAYGEDPISADASPTSDDVVAKIEQLADEAIEKEEAANGSVDGTDVPVTGGDMSTGDVMNDVEPEFDSELDPELELGAEDEFDGGALGDMDLAPDDEERDLADMDVRMESVANVASGSANKEQVWDLPKSKKESPSQLANLEPSPSDHDEKVHVPAKLKSALRSLAAEARKDAKNLGVTDMENHWFYNNLADAFEKLAGHLDAGTKHELKMAQVFMTTLMGPMLHKIPADVVKFIAKGGEERPLKDYMKPVGVEV